MKQSDNLGIFTKIIAQNASAAEMSAVPEEQATAGDGTASISTGFPPETFLPRGAGGVPPRGQDMNGFLNRLSRAIQVLQAGYIGPFNAAFAAAIKGYPAGAVVSGLVPGTFWVSTADNNITTPGASGALWKSLFDGYITQTWADGQYQPLLNFTPVQQGGANGIGTNKTCLGWASSGSGRLHYAIDGLDQGDLANISDLPTFVVMGSSNPNTSWVSGSISFVAKRAGFLKLDINAGNDSGSRMDGTRTQVNVGGVTAVQGGGNTGATGLFIGSYIYTFNAGATVVMNMTIAFLNSSANNQMYASGLVCYV